MTDEKSSIFTDKASNKLRSPDDLDECVRVTNPSVWVVLAACACLMIGLLAWGFLGTAETSVGALPRIRGARWSASSPPRRRRRSTWATLPTWVARKTKGTDISTNEWSRETYERYFPY